MFLKKKIVGGFKWFQPIWKVLVNLDHFPKSGWKQNTPLKTNMTLEKKITYFQ